MLPGPFLLQSDRQCRVTGNRTLGPEKWVFKDSGAALIHNVSGSMGSIDPSHYFDENTNTHFLLYKSDGNAQKKPTVLYAVPLSDDGLSVKPSSVSTALLANDPNTWEKGCIEAPWIIKHLESGNLFLFYSGPGYTPGNKYRVGVAASRNGNILGPWEKRSNPILVQRDVQGDGSMFESPGNAFFASVAFYLRHDMIEVLFAEINF